MKKLFFFLSLFLLFKPTTANAIEINPLSPELQKTTDMINNSVVGEQIKEFKTDVTINKDGSMDVKETLLYYFDTDRHGIYRYIPFTLSNNGKRMDMEMKFGDVTDQNGKKYKVDKSREDEQWVLQIGDPDKTITGDHTYIITYNVKGGLRYFEEYDELYWNITGNGWTIPIRKTSVNIKLPENVAEDQVKIACFTGAYGEKRTNCIGRATGPAAQFETTIFLNSYEGLTIAYSFPKGVVDVLLPVEYVPFFERWYGKITLAGLIAGAILWYLVLPVYLIIRWIAMGRDPDVGRPVTATFDLPRVDEFLRVKAGPPKVDKRFLTPAEVGALVDEHVDKRDLFATIVDLARRGHMKISEPKEKEFHLIKTDNSSSSVIPHLMRDPSLLKKDKLLPFEQTLYDGIFADGDDIKLKDVKFYATASKAETEIYNLMVEHKYFNKSPRTTRNIYYGLGAAGMMTFNFVLAFVAFFFGRIMPRKTILGAQISNQAKGLKNFLSSQERQLNFQGDKKMLFEKLLPAAVAFGVEKAWAKRFEKFDLKNPDWYEGSSGQTFRSAVFASHLSSSYSSFASSATPPSSSSSSGFGGGGSSGGGGGGGGGGSW